jgi:uroporphyrin-III C-methyltransferase/precorrin-2 dehydrogenase/sirohydrochlorin ferrochelatase
MTTLVGLEVAGRPVLVAGGGPVAARRAQALADDGAQVMVVAPRLCESLVDLVLNDTVTWRDRGVVRDDLDGMWLVQAATDDADLNAQLCRWATEQRTWSVCASAVELGTARTPATARQAGLVIGVASQGAPDPTRVAAIRDRLAAILTISAELVEAGR